ncbi:MAG: 50S ribosomal protein L32 [Bacillota bacterium]
MAVPKKKHSKSRRNRRRSQWKATAPNLVECSNCQELKITHRVCPSCGYYDGRRVKAAK